MIKEVIQGKIDSIKICIDIFRYMTMSSDKESLNIITMKLNSLIDELFEQLEQSESIEVLERRAFDAGKHGELVSFETVIEYEEFEDYLKSKQV